MKCPKTSEEDVKQVNPVRKHFVIKPTTKNTEQRYSPKIEKAKMPIMKVLMNRIDHKRRKFQKESKKKKIQGVRQDSIVKRDNERDKP